MATTTKSANDSKTQVDGAAAPSALSDAAKTAAQVRAEIVSSLTFAEAVGACLKSAHWSDVLAAADKLAAVIDNPKGAIREKTLTAQLRKVATLAPHSVAEFRFAVVSYQLSGRRSNPTQNAELAAKLPTLRKVGTLKAGEISFGGLAIPPAIGEF